MKWLIIRAIIIFVGYLFLPRRQVKVQCSDGCAFSGREINAEIEDVISVIEKIVSVVFGTGQADKVKYTLTGYCQKLAPI